MSAATVASAVVIRVCAWAEGCFCCVGLVMRLGLGNGPLSVQIAGTLSSPLGMRTHGAARRTALIGSGGTKPNAIAALPSLTSEAAHVPFRAATSRLVGHHASLPHPHLRRSARKRHRQGGAAVRLVPPHPRPWRIAVHRPARPLRHHPGGGRSQLALVQGGREAALGMGGADRRQGAQASGRHRESRPADRGHRSLHQRDRSARCRRRTADARIWRSGISGRHPSEISLSRSAPRAAPSQHHDAWRGDRTPSGDA